LGVAAKYCVFAKDLVSNELDVITAASGCPEDKEHPRFQVFDCDVQYPW
jgi:hypothetical protein